VAVLYPAADFLIEKSFDHARKGRGGAERRGKKVKDKEVKEDRTEANWESRKGNGKRGKGGEGLETGKWEYAKDFACPSF